MTPHQIIMRCIERSLESLRHVDYTDLYSGSCTCRSEQVEVVGQYAFPDEDVPLREAVRNTGA